MLSRKDIPPEVNNESIIVFEAFSKLPHSRKQQLNKQQLKNGSFSRKSDSTLLTQGSKIKLLRACNFCRKRKVKCIVTPKESSCGMCIIKNMKCSFDHKFETCKRKCERAAVADGKSSFEKTKFIQKLKSTDLIPSLHSTGERLNVSKGNKKSTLQFQSTKLNNFSIEDDLRSFEITDRFSNNFPLLSLTSSDMGTDLTTILQLYTELIEPYTPFLLIDCWKDDVCEANRKFAFYCIKLGASMESKEAFKESSVSEFLQSLNEYFEEGRQVSWTILTLSSFFLLPLRIRVPKDIIKNSLLYFNELYQKQGGKLPINLIVGAFMIDAYFSLFSNSMTLYTDSNILIHIWSHLNEKKTNDFSFYFIYVGYYIYKLLKLISQKELSEKDFKMELIQLENNILLWPVNLPREFLVVDKAFAEERALILHIVHNNLLTLFYSQAIFRYGKMLSISPTPGLYLFLSTVSGSTFRVERDLIKRWTLAADSQLYLANILLLLHEIMEFESIRLSLTQFHINNNVLDIDKQANVSTEVTKLLSSYDVLDEGEAHGAIIFWLFRDVRSMSLQICQAEMTPKT
ncbi:uncharacterized protein PRCAT00003470001 [Priceomyces carsonii]|uniref:uncharacterized protein n=1 Tax=Priceomyces carsonii TaxID=28549 RepID=UPI002ED93487|nr:unnamed protein product [Priceomyces carsonii]